MSPEYGGNMGICRGICGEETVIGIMSPEYAIICIMSPEYAWNMRRRNSNRYYVPGICPGIWRVKVRLGEETIIGIMSPEYA